MNKKIFTSHAVLNYNLPSFAKSNQFFIREIDADKSLYLSIINSIKTSSSDTINLFLENIDILSIPDFYSVIRYKTINIFSNNYEILIKALNLHNKKLNKLILFEEEKENIKKMILHIPEEVINKMSVKEVPFNNLLNLLHSLINYENNIDISQCIKLEIDMISEPTAFDMLALELINHRNSLVGNNRLRLEAIYFSDEFVTNMVNTLNNSIDMYWKNFSDIMQNENLPKKITEEDIEKIKKSINGILDYLASYTEKRKKYIYFLYALSIIIYIVGIITCGASFTSFVLVYSSFYYDIFSTLLSHASIEDEQQVLNMMAGDLILIQLLKYFGLSIVPLAEYQLKRRGNYIFDENSICLFNSIYTYNKLEYNIPNYFVKYFYMSDNEKIDYSKFCDKNFGITNQKKISLQEYNFPSSIDIYNNNKYDLFLSIIENFTDIVYLETPQYTTPYLNNIIKIKELHDKKKRNKKYKLNTSYKNIICITNSLDSSKALMMQRELEAKFMLYQPNLSYDIGANDLYRNYMVDDYAFYDLIMHDSHKDETGIDIMFFSCFQYFSYDKFKKLYIESYKKIITLYTNFAQNIIDKIHENSAKMKLDIKQQQYLVNLKTKLVEDITDITIIYLITNGKVYNTAVDMYDLLMKMHSAIDTYINICLNLENIFIKNNIKFDDNTFSNIYKEKDKIINYLKGVKKFISYFYSNDSISKVKHVHNLYKDFIRKSINTFLFKSNKYIIDSILFDNTIKENNDREIIEISNAQNLAADKMYIVCVEDARKVRFNDDTLKTFPNIHATVLSAVINIKYDFCDDFFSFYNQYSNTMFNNFLKYNTLDGQLINTLIGLLKGNENQQEIIDLYQQIRRIFEGYITVCLGFDASVKLKIKNYIENNHSQNHLQEKPIENIVKEHICFLFMHINTDNHYKLFITEIFNIVKILQTNRDKMISSIQSKQYLTILEEKLAYIYRSLYNQPLNENHSIFDKKEYFNNNDITNQILDEQVNIQNPMNIYDWVVTFGSSFLDVKMFFTQSTNLIEGNLGIYTTLSSLCINYITTNLLNIPNDQKLSNYIDLYKYIYLDTGKLLPHTVINNHTVCMPVNITNNMSIIDKTHILFGDSSMDINALHNDLSFYAHIDDYSKAVNIFYNRLKTLLTGNNSNILENVLLLKAYMEYEILLKLNEECYITSNQSIEKNTLYGKLNEYCKNTSIKPEHIVNKVFYNTAGVYRLKESYKDFINSKFKNIGAMAAWKYVQDEYDRQNKQKEPGDNKPFEINIHTLKYLLGLKDENPEIQPNIEKISEEKLTKQSIKKMSDDSPAVIVAKSFYHAVCYAENIEPDDDQLPKKETQVQALKDEHGKRSYTFTESLHEIARQNLRSAYMLEESEIFNNGKKTSMVNQQPFIGIITLWILPPNMLEKMKKNTSFQHDNVTGEY